MELENCYGIKDLSVEFKFLTNNPKIQLVYAQNGTMKTSFAKTFKKLSSGFKPEELVYNRTSVYSIKADGCKYNDSDFSNSFYVVPSDADYFQSENISKLLVEDSYRKRYETEINKINEKKQLVIKHLKSKTKIKSDGSILAFFAKDFGDETKDFIQILKEEIIENFGLGDLNYNILTNSKVESLFSDLGFVDSFKEYMTVFKDLLSKSQYFNNDFNHNNGDNVSKTLGDNNFFEADHKVRLNGDSEEISTIEELEKKIEEDKKKILENPKLQEKFESVDSKLKSNESVREFRKYINENQFILGEMENYKDFKKRLWKSYLYVGKDLVKDLIDVYDISKPEIDLVINHAKEHIGEWHNVIKIFKDRFNPLYGLSIKNQEDIILKGIEKPEIHFDYCEEGGRRVPIAYEKLSNVLSTGQKRTLFILNVLFDIEARKKSGYEQVIIIDDIANSFDYANKYAILEYLKELAEENNGLYFIILTHNFDFFRTAHFRFFGQHGKRSQSLMANIRNDGKIQLIEAEYVNPFKTFRDRFHREEKIFIAMIPFVRNIVEYLKGENQNDEYNTLTSCLHIKSDSYDLIVSDIFDLMKLKLGISTNISFNSVEKNIIDFILGEADKIITSNSNLSPHIDLDNKIVLSIAIRLLGEKIMIKEIKTLDKNYDLTLANISNNQTKTIFEKYKILFNLNCPKGDCLKKLLITTSDNIHINSFMYEPILDTSEKELKTLYSDLKTFYV